MTTSKIKEIVKTNPFTNSYGTTIYHHLLMENGEKIDIGKKTEQKVGWELTYEIIGDNQQEYRKAKASKPEDRPASTNQAIDNRQASIVAQFCFREANLILINRGFSGQYNEDAVDEVGKVALLISHKVKEIEKAILAQ